MHFLYALVTSDFSGISKILSFYLLQVKRHWMCSFTQSSLVIIIHISDIFLYPCCGSFSSLSMETYLYECSIPEHVFCFLVSFSVKRKPYGKLEGNCFPSGANSFLSQYYFKMALMKFSKTLIYCDGSRAIASIWLIPDVKFRANWAQWSFQ